MKKDIDVFNLLKDAAKEVMWDYIKTLNEINIRNTEFGRGLNRGLNFIDPENGQIRPEIIQDLKKHLGGQYSQKIKFIDPDAFANIIDINVGRAYLILGISPSSTDEQLKKRYHQLAQEYHPDKAPQATDEIKKLAHDKFIEVKWAYEYIRYKRGLTSRRL